MHTSTAVKSVTDDSFQAEVLDAAGFLLHEAEDPAFV